MRTILFFAATLIVVLALTVIILLCYKNYLLKKQVKKLGKIDVWKKLAYTDDLTQTKNRTSYNEKIEYLKSKKREMVGIILFDIDNFKYINDTKGHLAGDEILKFVAKTLQRIFCKSNYTVYRIGGDEFAVIAENANEEEIIGLMLDLKTELEEKNDIRISKGYSFVKDDIEKAFSYADEMLYADKKSKK